SFSPCAGGRRSRRLEREGDGSGGERALRRCRGCRWRSGFGGNEPSALHPDCQVGQTLFLAVPLVCTAFRSTWTSSLPRRDMQRVQVSEGIIILVISRFSAASRAARGGSAP